MSKGRHISKNSRTSGRGLRVVIAGGGTGGHLFPGIAIAEAFRQRAADSRVLFVTTGRPIETRVLSRTDYRTARIPAAGVKGKGVSGKLAALVKVPAGILAALALFIRFRPDAVIGMGGYSAAPVILAAWMMRIFRVIHEQNRIPGMTNRFLAKYAHRIYVSFADTDMGGYAEKVRLTGNPIRTEIADQLSQEKTSGSTGSFTVLILGGSQGAHAINMTVLAALSRLTGAQAFRFIHQTGEADVEKVQAGYERAGIKARVSAFFDDMAACYASADLAVCRAGATSVAEVAAAGLPAIFIPYPYAADNHQYFNAKSLSESGAAELIEQSALDGEHLAERINYYARHESVRREMQAKIGAFAMPQAAAEIAADISGALESRKSKPKGRRTVLSIN